MNFSHFLSILRNEKLELNWKKNFLQFIRWRIFYLRRDEMVSLLTINPCPVVYDSNQTACCWNLPFLIILLLHAILMRQFSSFLSYRYSHTANRFCQDYIPGVQVFRKSSRTFIRNTSWLSWGPEQVNLFDIVRTPVGQRDILIHPSLCLQISRSVTSRRSCSSRMEKLLPIIFGTFTKYFVFRINFRTSRLRAGFPFILTVFLATRACMCVYVVVPFSL